MKRLFLFLFALLIFAACSKDDTGTLETPETPETPEEPETLVTIIFSNTALESMLLDSSRDHTPSVIDSDGDGAISLDEAAAVTKIDAVGASVQSKLATISKSSSLTLTSLDDIFNFENLVELDCSGNEITTIDLSANSALEALNCSNNAVTEVVLSLNSALKSLDCSNNSITEIDLSSNSSLETLVVSNNSITEIDLSSNATLTSLDCSDNSIETIDLSSNSSLETLVVSNNVITSLDISANTSLTAVDCSGNQIKTLDVSSLENLEDGALNCGGQTNDGGEIQTIVVVMSQDQKDSGSILSEDSKATAEIYDLLDDLIAKDRAALVELYNATDGDNWKNNLNWCGEESVDEWYGVEVDSDGRVTAVNLNYNELSGEIPSSIGDLSELEYLEVWHNNISGEIPAEIGKLTNLLYLTLEENDLTGEIPDEFENLVNLVIFSLYDNNLEGEIPSWLINMSDIWFLDLSYNNFTGSLPAELGDPSLGNSIQGGFILYVNNNRLSGEVPQEIFDHPDYSKFVLNPQQEGYGFTNLSSEEVKQ